MANTLKTAKDPFQLPSIEVLREIEQKQNERAKAIRAKRREVSQDERSAAAEIIQRNYRGHRERRAIKGLALDSGTRWMEVCLISFRHPIFLQGGFANLFVGFEGW